MEKWRNILDDQDIAFLFTIYNLKEIVTFSNLRNFCFLSTFFFGTGIKGTLWWGRE